MRFRPKILGVGEKDVVASQMIPGVRVAAAEAANETARVG